MGPRRRPSNPFFLNSEVRSVPRRQFLSQRLNGCLSSPLGGSSPGGGLARGFHAEFVDCLGGLPNMPPNRNTSNFSPSVGASSCAAAGSRRHTRDLSWAYNSSTPRCSGVKLEICFRASGIGNAAGSDGLRGSEKKESRGSSKTHTVAAAPVPLVALGPGLG